MSGAGTPTCAARGGAAPTCCRVAPARRLDRTDLLGLERNVRAVWAAIEQAVTTRDFRPNPSRLCGWCDFKPLCPAFGGTPPELPETIEIITPETTASADQDSALP